MTEGTPADLGVAAGLPIEPDIDAEGALANRPAPEDGPFRRSRRGRWPRLRLPVLAVVFAGGVTGGLARYAVSSLWPTPVHGFPWATFTVNTAGAFTLALLIVVLSEVLVPRRYLRPLLGTGFLGAFTTFSAVVAGTDQLAAHGHPRTAALYLGGSVLAALGAASFGLVLGRAIAASRRRRNQPHPARRR